MHSNMISSSARPTGNPMTGRDRDTPSFSIYLSFLTLFSDHGNIIQQRCNWRSSHTGWFVSEGGCWVVVTSIYWVMGVV